MASAKLERATSPLLRTPGASVSPIPVMQRFWKRQNQPDPQSSEAGEDRKQDDILQVYSLAVDCIDDNPSQARQVFDNESLAGLASSIERNGLQQPIVVRKAATDGRYILIAGERRLRAHKLLGLSNIAAIVTTAENHEVVSLIENIQRDDLNIVELAFGLKALQESMSLKQHEVAASVGLNENIVGRTLAVLGLFDLAPELLGEYQTDPSFISNSMMMELSAISNPDTLRALWERAKLGKLARSEVRNAAKREKLERERANKPKAEPTPAVLERRLVKKVERSLKTLEREVETIEVARDVLNDDQRQGLRTLRGKIDQMLI